MYMTPWNLQPVIKYESYDPDLDVDADTDPTAYIQNTITFGFNYFLNDWTRVQLNYVYSAEETVDTEFDNDMIMLQVQAKF